MTGSDGSLKLSVFTIGQPSADECRMVIGELRRQTFRSELELIVVAESRGGIRDEEVQGFGSVQWVIVPEVRTCGQAMEAAVRTARAPYVTYAEEHSYFDEYWAERLVAAHEAGYDAVVSAMENANPSTLTSWASLYGQFGPVVAPVASGEISVIAGHHTSYRKELLLAYGERCSAMLEDEAVLGMDLKARGTRMFLAGDAVSRHLNASRLSAYVRTDYLGMRSFAATRAAGWPVWKRVAYAGAAPLVPLIRLRRALKEIRRTGRAAELLPRILFPMSVAMLAGGWGEFLGYVVGARDCAERRVPLELHKGEWLAPEDRWSKSATLER